MNRSGAVGGEGAATDWPEGTPRPARPLPRGRQTPDGDVLDDVDRRLGELVDNDRRARATGSRRAADLRRVFEQDTATLAGILRDHGEQGVDLLIEHDGGRLAGRLVGLAQDHIVIEGRDDARRSVLRVDAVITVAVDRTRRPPEPWGRRPVASPSVLRDALVGAMEQRLPLRAHLSGRNGTLGGIPIAVGEDQFTLRVEAASRQDVLIPLARVVRVDLAQ